MRRIRIVALIALVLLVLVALGWGWMLREAERENQTTLHDLHRIEQNLLQLELTVWLQDLRMRSMLLSKLTGQDIPASLLRQADVRSALKALEKEAKPHTRLIPILRELLERGYILERRYTSWRRSLERVEKPDQVLPVYEQYTAGAPALLSSVESEVQRLREAVAAESTRLTTETQLFLGRVQTLGLVVIALLLVGSIVAILVIGRAEEAQTARLLSAPLNEPLPEEPGLWLDLARSYNQLLFQSQVLQKAVYHLAEHGGLWDEDKARLPSDTLGYFQAILEREAKQEERIRTISEEKRKILQQLQATEKHLSEQVEELRTEVGALQNLFPIAEVNEKGEILSKNDLWLQLSSAQSWNNVGDIHPELTLLVRERTSKQGVLQIGESLFAYAYIAYRQGKQRRALLSLMEVRDIAGRLREMEAALAQAQRRLGEVEGILAQMRQQQSQLQVRHSQEAERLLRQRQSLQTLLKLPALQSGSVIEGLSAITEVAATLEPEARYSFWVFSEGGMHCLEAYDPALLTHSNTLDLPADVAQWVREQFNGNVPAGPYAVESSPLAPYLSDRKVVWLFPLYLDEELIGAFFIEGGGAELDTEYPLLLARVASLLLQQGHRKLVEQEMLSYIEQAHALEEELRQNIEELEASAEEMRRTQAELRGQITALNTAALVIEMNPEGRIIYVNDAFLRLFGQTIDKVLGMPYVRLRKEEEKALVEEVYARLRQGEVWQEVVSYTNALGEDIWLQQTIVPVRHLSGEVYKYILVGFDITLQKQQELEIQHALTIAREHEQLLRENTEELRRSNENYRASQMQLSAQLEALNSAAWLFETDAEGHITYISQGFAEALGYTPDKLKGMSYGILFSERQPLAILQGHWRNMQVGQIWKSEVELKGALGQSYWAIMSSTPIIDRSRGDRRPLLKTINVLFDITEQKEQEFRLIEQQDALSRLASDPALREGNIQKAFQVITDIALKTFKAYRVSLWLYEENDSARCIAVSEKEPHFHHPGSVVNRSLYPLYFQSLEREQVIAVVDALSDLRTRELALPLFKPNNVTSILDGVIRVGAKTVGLISVEHRYIKREWRLDEVNFLRSLAASAASVIEEEQQAYARRLQEAYVQLEKQKQELEDAMRDIRESIRYAKRMQKNILPSDSLLDHHLGKENYFIIWRPRDRHGVGGDFYWFSDAPKDSYFIIVADGTGHGVPGAFMTLIGSILLDQIINKSGIYSPAQILHDLHIGVRQVLRQDVEGEEIASRDGMDIALVRYFPKTYKLIYAGANLPLYYFHAGELKEIKPDKKAIGGEQLEEERFFTEHEVQLEAGDLFFLFTDGVVDQWGGPAGKRFGSKQLKEFILETMHEPSMPRRRALFNIRWKEWKDYGEEREQVDDVTMWGVRAW